MNEEFKRQPPNEDNLPAASGQDNFLAVIERLSTNPDVDVAKIKQFVEMQEHILDRNAKQAFNASMVRAQANMPEVPKDKKNTQTNTWYSKYETILKYTKPVYTKEGFSLLFYEGETTRENEIRVCADIMHEQGHTEKRYVDVPIDDKGPKGTVNKTRPHAKGSSLSYGKGYLIRMIFNIPTGDDDDGNAAGSEYVSEDQAIEINDLLKETGADVKKFLKVAKAESVETILQSEYPMLIKQLRKKRDNMRQPGDE